MTDSDNYPQKQVPQNSHNTTRRKIIRGTILTATWSLSLTFTAITFSPSIEFSRWVSQRMLVAHALAFPAITGVLVSAVALTALGWAILRGRTAASPYRGWGAALPATLLLIAAVGLAAMPWGPPWAHRPVSAPSAAGPELRIATLNSQDSLAQSDLAALTKLFNPDVVVVPEGSTHTLNIAAAGTPFAGGIYETQSSGFTEVYSGQIASTAVMVHAKTRSHYQPSAAEPTSFGTVFLKPSTAGYPAIMGIHAAPPLPGLMDAWRADLAAVTSFASSYSSGPLILAGDFNATPRHGPLTASDRLVDTAAACGVPDRGTWPAEAPPWLRSPIDHVFVTPEIQVLSCKTARIGVGDHVAYMTVLRLPA